jgi:hypothetical protein
MDNPETLATLGTQDTGQRLEKTKGAIKNEQSRDTGHMGTQDTGRWQTKTKQNTTKKNTTQKTKTMSSTSPRRSLGFSQQIKLAATKYNWNIVESGVKHQKPNQAINHQ